MSVRAEASQGVEKDEGKDDGRGFSNTLPAVGTNILSSAK